MIEVSQNLFYVPCHRTATFVRTFAKHYGKIAHDVLLLAQGGQEWQTLGGKDWRPLRGGGMQTRSIEDIAPFYSMLSPWAQIQIEAAGKKIDRRELMHKLLKSVDFSKYIPLTMTLEKYQLETVAYTLLARDTLVADDPGTGKTVSNIVAANALSAKTILVICPSSAKYNWRKHFLDWCVPAATEEQIFICAGKDGYSSSRRRREQFEKLQPEDRRVIIINFDILSSHRPYLNATYDVLICDESHRLQTDGTLRTSHILGGKAKTKTADERMNSIPALKRVFSTGTPADKPIQLWPLLRALDPVGLGADYERFIVKYCGAYRDPLTLTWVAKGATNLPDLRERMEDKLMIRHTDKVLNLPPVTETTFVMEPPPTLLDVESKMVSEIVARLTAADDPQDNAPAVVLSPAQIKEWKTKIGEAVVEQTSGINGIITSMDKMSTYRKEMAAAKAPEVVKFLIDLHKRYPDEPIVAFGWHKKEMVKAVAAKLKRYGAVETITGDDTAEEKYNITQRLQAGELTFLVANMAAAGEALTMTKARIIVIIEWDWSARMMRQVLKRVARRGQTRPVNAYYLVFDNTIEGNVVAVARRKMVTQSALFDDVEEEEDTKDAA